jgi:hypothetical protein
MSFDIGAASRARGLTRSKFMLITARVARLSRIAAACLFGNPMTLTGEHHGWAGP